MPMHLKPRKGLGRTDDGYVGPRSRLRPAERWTNPSQRPLRTLGWVAKHPDTLGCHHLRAHVLILGVGTK
jgi:hypothetical protein